MTMPSWFGAAAPDSMLVFYWLEPRSAWYSFGFGMGCAASSLYAWLSGTWPFGVVKGVWAILAVVRWKQRLLAFGAGASRLAEGSDPYLHGI